MKQWPILGSKAKYTGTSKWFFFKNILEDANELLENGKEYTISKLELASSWCAVILEEFPDKKFSLSWFAYEKKLTTEEVIQIEREGWKNEVYEFLSLKELKDRKNENKN